MYNNNSPQFSLSSFANGVTLMLSQSSVTIPAGGSAAISVSMFFPASAASGIYEGRLIVKSTAGPDMTLPFAGRLGPSLDGVTIENAWITRPVISSNTDAPSLYAGYAHVAFSYTGRSSEQRVYVTDLDDNPVAYGGRYNVSTDTQTGASYILMNSVRRSMFLYNNVSLTYDTTASPLPDGVYKAYLQITPSDSSYEKQTVFVSKFVVEGTLPVLTVDTENVIEYPYGADKVIIEGNIWSEAAKLCIDHDIPSQYYSGNPVFGQEINALAVTGGASDFVYSPVCDEDGNFASKFNVTPASRTSQVTISMYALDYYKYWIGTYSASGYYGINKSALKTVKYTETAGVTNITAASNGTMTAKFSNSLYNFTADDFTAEYSNDGGVTFKPLTITGEVNPTGSGASAAAVLTFNPVRRTTEEQTIGIRLSYKGGGTFTKNGAFTVEPAAAIYSDNDGTDTPIVTEFSGDNITDGTAALALLPETGYVKLGESDYEAVTIAWAWNGTAYDGETAGEYNVLGTVTGDTTSTTIDGAIIVPRAQAPLITAQPNNISVRQNNLATLSVTAASPDNGALTYQWYVSTASDGDGTAIPEATARTYSPGTSAVGVKYYSVKVTNTRNNTTADAISGTASVTVTAPPPPVTDIPSVGETTQPDPIETVTENGTTTAQITTKPTTATVNGVVTTTASVDQSTMDNAIAEAAKNRTSEEDSVVIEIKVEAPENAQAAAVEIPAAAITALTGEKNTSVAMDMGFAKITLDSKAVETIGNSAGENAASISVALADTETLSDEAKALVGNRMVVDIKITTGDSTVSNLGGGTASVSLPYSPAAEELQNPDAIVVYYIDSEGNLKNVLGRYNEKTGTVDFETDHFSKYAVAFNPVTYPDAPLWAQAAVTFTAARGIVRYEGLFDPDKPVTRGEFLIALMRTYAIDVSTPKDEYAFADISKDSELYAYATAARELGLTDGSDTARNLFDPDGILERQQAAAFFIKALNAMNKLPKVNTGRKLSDYTDKNDVAEWAVPYLETAVKTGIIHSTSNIMFAVSPVRLVTRSQMVQLIYNLF